MGQETKSVKELIGDVKSGRLRLPEMQRGYVWRAPQVCALLDSLYRGYPSGSLLAWKTEGNTPTREFAVGRQSEQSERLLLDGQQRLTSLCAVISGEPVKVRKGKRERTVEILFNLEHPEKPESVSDDDDNEEDATEDARAQKAAFAVSNKYLASKPTWVKVTDVFKGDSESETKLLNRAGVKEMNSPNYGKYRKRLDKLQKICDYEYRVDVLERSLSYEEVTNIFVRVNSMGTKLRGSDLALAQITAKWPGSLAVFEKYREEISARPDARFDIDLGILTRNLVVFASERKQSRFAKVGEMTADRLKGGWEKSKDGMDYAVNFLRANAGIDSPLLLSSPYILITLAAYGHSKDYKLNEDELNKLRGWVLAANAKGRYSLGASESILNTDLSELNKGGVDRLMDALLRQVGKLEISPNELTGRNPRLLKMMFLAFRAGGAKDWGDGLNISLAHSGEKHRLQHHHIFPKAVLHKAGYKPEQIDDIANLCFISGKENRKILDKPPVEYFPKVIEERGENAFTSQCIPLDEDLRTPDKYEDFLAERRKMIAARLNEFIRGGG